MTKFPAPASRPPHDTWQQATMDKPVLSPRHKNRFKHIKIVSAFYFYLLSIFKYLKTRKTLLQWRQSLPDQFSHKHPVDSASWLGITAWDGLVLWGEWSTNNVLRKYWFYNVLKPHEISWPSSWLKVSLYFANVIKKLPDIAALVRKVTLFLYV